MKTNIHADFKTILVLSTYAHAVTTPVPSGKRIAMFCLILLIMAGTVAGYFIIRNKAGESSGSFKFTKEDIVYFEDRSNSLQLEDILAMPDSMFRHPPSNVANFSFNDHNVWLRFNIDGRISHDDIKFLQVNNPMLDSIELYERRGAEIDQIGWGGDAMNFSKRNFAHHLFVFPIEIPFGTTRQYHMKVNSGGEQLILPLSIYTQTQLSDRDATDRTLRGSFIGLVAFIVLFNVFIYILIRETSSLHYVLYSVAMFLLQLSLSGHAFQHLWPGSPWMANVANPVFGSLAMVFLMHFSRQFLNIAEYYPKIDQVIRWGAHLLLANACLAMFWTYGFFVLSLVIANAAGLLFNMLLVTMSALIYRKHFKPAQFFFFGFLFFLIPVSGFILTNFGVLQNSFFSDYGMLLGSTGEATLLSYAIVHRFKTFRDQAVDSLSKLNEVVIEQNVMLEKKVRERTLEISDQNSKLENQKEQILSSIRYAERIQKNLLPSDEEMKTLFPESFVFYQPKDIVSGDFYWIGKTKLNGVSGPAHDVTLFAACDCTGHGVPGAMVSVMGSNMIRETLQQSPEAMPHEMLRQIDARMISNMNTGENKHVSDGMDMVLCAIQHDTMQLRMAGANNDVLIWRDNTFIALKGTARPIGARNTEKLKEFGMQSIQLEKGDVIYAFTDGYADQFGGDHNKKLKISGLKNVLASVAMLSMTEQKEKIRQFFETWKGMNEQIDDVCLMGIRV